MFSSNAINQWSRKWKENLFDIEIVLRWYLGWTFNLITSSNVYLFDAHNEEKSLG